jgi:hypothetical protein
VYVCVGEVIIETEELKQAREARERDAARAAMPAPAPPAPPAAVQQEEKKGEAKVEYGAGHRMVDDEVKAQEVYQIPVIDQPMIIMRGESQMVTVLAISNPWLPPGATAEEHRQFAQCIDKARLIIRDISLRQQRNAPPPPVLSDSEPTSMSLI